MSQEKLFVERQYLGRDMTWISVRMTLALFCFIVYYLNVDHLPARQLFFIVGSCIILVSIVMMYLVHYKTAVLNGNVVLSGLWSTRLVKIDLSSIASVEKKSYSTYIFNNPVYNLHKNGKIRFYSGGKDAVWLTDKDGLIYIIGTHRQEELYNAILKCKS